MGKLLVKQSAEIESKMKPQISVIIPSYNHAHFLPEALQSVLAQTFLDWEAIVVDDGSKDNTREVVSRFCDARIRYIFQENRGLAGARNTGVRAASAGIIALLDADDLWQPNFLTKMLDWLKRHPQAVAAYCGYQFIDEKSKVVGKESVIVFPPESFHQILLEHGNWLVPCSVIFHKSLAEDVGLFDEELQAVEDADLWVRLSARHEFVGFPEALVRYRRHSTNMTSDPQRMISAQQHMMEKIYGTMEGEPSSWPELKKKANARLYKSAAWRYLAARNVKNSADYVGRLMRFMPEEAFEIGFWRKLAHVHLPVEYRDDLRALDWCRVQEDFLDLFTELNRRAAGSSVLKQQLPKLKGYSFLALAEDAVANHDFWRATLWLLRSFKAYPALLFARPFWGTVFRQTKNTVDFFHPEKRQLANERHSGNC